MGKSQENLVFVFDLDKTIGYFTQIAIFMEGIEDYIGRKMKLREFFKLLDLYPEIFRPDMFKVFRYLKELKKKKKSIKVMIYTNNIGPKSWVHNIRKYIEHKLEYKLFDRTIAAWKVGNKIYEKCRTTHEKTYKDLLKCGKLDKNDDILFLDDQRHPHMLHEKIRYLYLHEWHNDIIFEKMIQTFLKSKQSSILEDKKNFKDHIMSFAKNDPLGFRYIERPGENLGHYDKKSIIKEIKRFVKLRRFNKITRKKRKKVKIQKRQTRKNKTPGISS
jgi:hypothetical protein